MPPEKQAAPESALESLESKQESQARSPEAVLGFANEVNRRIASARDKLKDLPKSFQDALHNNIVQYFLTSADRYDVNRERGLSRAEFERYKADMLKKLDEIVQQYGAKKEKFAQASEAASEAAEKAARTEIKETEFREENLSRPDGVRTELQKFALQSDGVRKEAADLSATIAEFHKALQKFEEGKSGWSVFLRGSPFADDPETIAMKNRLMRLKDEVAVKMNALQAKKRIIARYGEKLNGAGDVLRKQKLDERDAKLKSLDKRGKVYEVARKRIETMYAEIFNVIDRVDSEVSDTVLQENLANAQTLSELETQQKFLNQMEIDRPNLWNATGGLVFGKIGEGWSLLTKDVLCGMVLDPASRWVKQVTRNIPVVNVLADVSASLLIDLPSGVIEGAGELVNGLTTLVAHPGDSLKGMASLIGRNPQDGKWSAGNAGMAWKEMGKAMIAHENFERGEVGKGIGKVGLNIILTATGLGAAGKGAQGARLAYVTARASGASIGRASIKASTVGARIFAKDFSRRTADLPRETLKSANGLMQAPRNLYAWMKTDKVFRLTQQIEHGLDELGELQRNFDEATINGRKISEMPGLAGKSAKELAEMSGDELARLGITDARSIEDFMAFRTQVEVVENLELTLRTSRIERAKLVAAGKGSEALPTAAPRQYKIGDKVKIRRSSGAIQEADVIRFDEKTDHVYVTWMEDGKPKSRSYRRADIDELNPIVHEYERGQVVRASVKPGGAPEEGVIIGFDSTTGDPMIAIHHIDGSIKRYTVSRAELDNFNIPRTSKAEIPLEPGVYKKGEIVRIRRSSGAEQEAHVLGFDEQTGDIIVSWLEEDGRMGTRHYPAQELDEINRVKQVAEQAAETVIELQPYKIGETIKIPGRDNVDVAAIDEITGEITVMYREGIGWKREKFARAVLDELNPLKKIERPKRVLQAFSEGQEVYRKLGNGVVERGWVVEKVNPDGTCNMRKGTSLREAQSRDDIWTIDEIENASEIQSMLGNAAANFERMKFFILKKQPILAARDFSTLFKKWPLKQQNVGNCYLISALNSLRSSPHFEWIVRTSLKKVDGGWEVRIPLGDKNGQWRRVTPNDLEPQKNPRYGMTDRHGKKDDRKYLDPVDASEGFQILEAAFIKYQTGGALDRIAIEGGFGHQALLELMGTSFRKVKIDGMGGRHKASEMAGATRFQYGDAPKFSASRDPAVRRDLFEFLDDFHPSKQMATANTPPSPKGHFEDFAIPGVDYKFAKGHAYSIIETIKPKLSPDGIGRVRVVNPWDTGKVITLTYDQFAEVFSQVSGAEIDYSVILARAEAGLKVAGK